jgi:uncharacterized membrane protein
MGFAWHLYLMAFLYIIAGFNHFRNPKLYLKIIPNYLPNPKLLNQISGVVEILLGILLLFPTTIKLAAWGIIFMLLSFYMTHFYMITNKKASMNLPKAFLYFRLLLQIGLIYWAFQYTL